MLAATSTALKGLKIEHWLCSGSLLGARRDGKWIKNDDDGDISMTKDNFEKLNKQAKEFGDKLNKNYAFQTYPDGCIVEKKGETDASMR